ncbi:hypothetical protein C3747_60g153 [Trypanosoma cruzi]|uniref:Small ribosomal subunit protein mS41 n=3 Tax=Trypanosoma cruzi TaxID=5693 RepID=V5DGB2_TRYCR|nr:hypothetical protein TCDM_14159 [Trypanosoma cruzi Dm28c]PBJ75766.1 hypothetical protein BCY84_10931 [Trypanosoma cruzi cruzi]PWU87816.1 hypothetical protein C4B63_84g50 [Trypanosoma cruzi]PWV11322.1 hypothetical protein C3747_60g153 [Trypanosoma cruzi]
MRSTCRLFDQTCGPHKSYKYTYMPDPRKLAPIETTSRSEILPLVIRPPTSYVPNHETFLEKVDIHRLKPTSDFKATFKDWNDLMSCGKRQLRVRGIPRMTRIAIRNAVHAFQNGNPPEYFDTKEEWLYYKQFKTIDFSYRVIPELPEKYRPHQNGIDQAPLPDYREINKMPEWARKEEERLKEKKI